MSAEPLLAAPTVVQVHLALALAAFLLGFVQFGRVKGDMAHRLLGWSWVVCMAGVALTSFWIRDLFDGFGPIHALAILVLVILPLGVRRARRGQVRDHARTMTGLFIGALVVAGIFTLLPGRLLGRVLIGW